MRRSDYRINERDSVAALRDRTRWEAARQRSPAFAAIYDLRFDDTALERLDRTIANRSIASAVRAVREGQGWSESLAGREIEVATFEGYVRRVLQSKDRSYVVELKDITASGYDHEQGWHVLDAAACNLPGARSKFRHVYEPFVPGRVVRVTYLPVRPQDAILPKYPPKITLRVAIESEFTIDGSHGGR